MRPLIRALVLAASIPAALSAEGLSAGDRQRLLAHLEMTEGWLVSEVKGLTDTQLRFRPKPESWTITSSLYGESTTIVVVPCSPVTW